MTQARPFTAAQISRAAKVAKDDGVIVELERNGVVIRILPTGEQEPQDERKLKEWD